MTEITTWLRSAVYNLWFVVDTTVLGLAGLVIRLFDQDRVADRSLRLAMLWSRTLLGGARLICGVEIVVIGRENLPDGPALIASQHQSAFDTFVWLLLLPRVAYVYKAELADIPLVGPLLRLSGQIKLNREANFAAIKALLRDTERAVADKRQIVIFPEGTRVDHGVEAELRPGVAALAARTGLPVIPVATDSGRLWGRRAFLKRPGRIHIVIGPPIPPRQGQAALMATLRQSWRTSAKAFDHCG